MSDFNTVINNISNSKEVQNYINAEYYKEEGVIIDIDNIISTAIQSRDYTVLKAVVDYALGLGYLYDYLLNTMKGC